MDPREDLVRHYKWLRQYGINDSHSGNASVRVDEDIWITPTGACADTLTPSDLIRCPMQSAPPEGASLDTALHLAVYQSNPAATAILHSHGAHSVAMTMNGEDFIPPDFEGAYYFQRIPVVTVDYARYLDEAPSRVAEQLAEHKIAVVRGHGVYACAETINLAYKWSCSFELSAKTAWLAQQAGTLPTNNS